MTPTGSPPRPTPQPPRPGGAGPAAAGVTLDPVKLFIKYKWLLAGAAALGIVLGGISHFVLLYTYPTFTSEVVMECKPPQAEIGTTAPVMVDAEEIERFMGTQVSLIKSDLILPRVINDPRLLSEAPNWSKQYMVGGRLDVVNATEDIEKIVSSSMIPNTYLIRMAVKTRNKEDAAGLVRLVKEKYLEYVRSTSNVDIIARKDALRKSIDNANRTLADLNTRRARMVRDEGIDTIQEGRSQSAETLRLVNFELVKVQQGIEATQVQLDRDEAQLQLNTGIQYDNTLRLAVDSAPEMQQLKTQINNYESSLSAMKQQGIQPQHRDYRLLVSQIEGTKQQLEQTRERLLRDAFESRIDQSRLLIQQLRAQEADLLRQAEELTTEVTELTRILGELTDIDRQIEATIELISKYELDLSDLTGLGLLDSTARVSVVQSETVPDIPSFPKIYIMVPLGMLLITGLVGGVVVVLEILDQRVKTAADVAGMRIPVLGLVPDAGEDPSSPEHPESVFRDLPNSVLAEHYRQLRTKVSKVMNRGGHKTLLIVGAVPESGATSVVSNLGSALAAAGNRVLVIDANFRRPSLHKAFDAAESPGLSDVLVGDRAFDEVISRREGQPDLLSAGTPGKRVVERLDTPGFDAVLTAARDRYDLVLIDVAPAVVAGDAHALSNRVDASMLVVRAMQAKRGMVGRLRNELSESKAEFLGAMVNGVRSAAGGYLRKNIRASAKYAKPVGEAA
jgi:succinoglycan biosynthesis transport protein ExoP